MAVPNTIADLPTLAGSNSPAGSETVFPNLDDYIRAHGACIRSIYAISSLTIAAASTTDVATSSGEYVGITGSATINSLGTGYAGCKRQLRFAGVCTLTHSTNLQLPNSANITTAVGDILSFRCITPGQWFLTAFSNPEGLPALASYAKLSGSNQPFTGAITISPGTLGSGRPLTVTGNFTTVAQSVDFTNTSVTTNAYQALTLTSGTSLGTVLFDAAPEFTTAPAYTGRAILQNSNNGVALSALGASSTIDFLTGPSRTLRGRVTAAGVLDWVGGISAGGSVTHANGATFGSNVAAVSSDLTKHIALHSTNTGFSVTAGFMNLLVAGQVYTFGSTGNFTAGGTVNDVDGDVRKIAAVTANATTTLLSSHLNKAVEKSNTTAYTYTLPTGLGAQGDAITIVNSGTAGNITVARSGTALYRGGVDADQTVTPGSIMTIYRSATANRWVA